MDESTESLQQLAQKAQRLADELYVEEHRRLLLDLAKKYNAKMARLKDRDRPEHTSQPRKTGMKVSAAVARCGH